MSMTEKMNYQETLDMDSINLELDGLKQLHKAGRKGAIALANEVLRTKITMTVDDFEDKLGHKLTAESMRAEIQCKELDAVLSEFQLGNEWMYQLYARAENCNLVGDWFETGERGCLLEMVDQFQAYKMLYSMAIDKVHAECWALVENACIRRTVLIVDAIDSELSSALICSDALLIPLLL